MRPLTLLLFIMTLLLLRTDGRRRGKSKYTQMGKKFLYSNSHSNFLDEDSLQVVMKYCETKHSSPGSKHASSRTKRCIQHSIDDLQYHCSDLIGKQSQKYCPQYLVKMVKKTKNLEKISKRRLRSGQSKGKTKILANTEISSKLRLRSGQSKVACMSNSTGKLNWYDSKTSICCNGHVILKPKSTDNCCHSNSSQACCIGCCGGVVYNRSEQFCLNQQIQKRILTTSNALSTTTPSGLVYAVYPDAATQDGLNREVHENGIDETNPSNHINIVAVILAGIAVATITAGLSVAAWKYRTHKCVRKSKELTVRSVDTFTQLESPESPSTGMFISTMEMQTRLTTVPGYKEQTHGELGAEPLLEREINQRHAYSTAAYSTVSDTHGHRAPSSVRNTDEDQASVTDSVCSELQVKLEDLPVTIVKSFDEGILTIEGLKATLHKDSSTPSMNESSNQFSSVQTQTFPIKQTNMRDSLGKPFQGDIVANINDRVVQLPHSDVVMTLPGNDLQDGPIQCYVSSLTDLGAMQRKLRLTDDEYFASPIAEYVLRGVQKLKDHAVMKLPICQYSDKFRVIRAVSDQGEDEEFKELYDVPFVGSRQEGLHLDTFCALSESKQFMFIYTKVFSVYLFVESGEKTDFDSNACTFIGVERIEKRTCARVTVHTYIFGHLSEFKDYRKEIEDDEKRFGRKMIDISKKLNFKEDVKSTDKLEVYMNIVNKDDWDFSRDLARPSLDMQKQRVNMNEIVKSKNGFAYSTISWSIKNKGDVIPSEFSCFIYIDHLNDTDGRSDQDKNVFQQDFNQSTRERRSRYRNSRRSSSYGSSLYSMESEGSFQQEMETPNRALDLVRKEMDTSMPSSCYDSKGNGIRPPLLANPAPEISKEPICSFDQRSVQNQFQDT